MNLGRYAEALGLLGDQNRLRLCVLLANRELCVSELSRITELAQPRVSTHLSRMREAGLVRYRRSGAQTFYGLSQQGLSTPVRELLSELAASSDATLQGDRDRLAALEAERRAGLPDSAILELDRDYSPGRTWQSLAIGHAALLRLGDVLDVGSGDGTAASVLAPYCRSLTCIDTNARAIAAARERLAHLPHARTQVADAHKLPFENQTFDDVLLFHTLTYAEHPEQVLNECGRVLRPNGRMVILCLDRYEPDELTIHYGLRHPGFAPQRLQSMLRAAGLAVSQADVACREAKKPHLRVVLALAEKSPAHAVQKPTISPSTTLTASQDRAHK